MKQLVLGLLLLFTICKNSASGQNKSLSDNSNSSILQITSCTSDTLLYEDFQSQAIPASWSNLDLDGTADIGGSPQNWFVYDYYEPLPDGGINYVAASSSFLDLPAIANNWLILPPLTICSNQIHLQWKSAPRSAPEYMDGYKILVSTTDNNPESFTDTIAVFAQSIGGLELFTEGTIHPYSHVRSGLGYLYEWRLPLQQYEGQQIYIAFVHDSEDDDLILLDDILVGEISRYDLSVDNLRPTNGYSIMPTRHSTPSDYIGFISNNSYTSSSGISLQLTVEKDATVLFSKIYTVPDLAPFVTDTIHMPANFQLTEPGNYLVKCKITGSESDNIPENNLFALPLIVSDSIYARDIGSIKDTAIVGTNITGVIGQVFELATADSLSSVTFHIADPVVGDTIVGEVYNFSGDGAFPLTPMFTTDTLVISDANTRDYTLPMYGGKKFVQPGSLLIGLREAKRSLLNLGVASEFPSDKGYVLYNGSWSSLSDYGIETALMLRANFTGSCAVPQIYGSSTYCTGTPIKLRTDSTYFVSMQWKKDGINIQGATSGSIMVAEPGTYSVEASREFCPVAISEDLIVTETPGAIATLTADKLTTECEKDTVTLEASGASSFVWLRDETTLEETGLLYKTVVPGNYAVIANAGQVCADTSDIISIVRPDLAPLSISGPATVEPYTQDVIYSVGGRSGSSYSWLAMPDAFFMGDGTPTIKIDFGNTSGNIEVTERSANGCMYFASKYVEVIKITSTPTADNKMLLIYPNPFSESFNFSVPNGEVTVFSTSGHKVEKFNVEKDGAIGADWSPGVYILQIKHDNKIDVLRVVKTE